MAKSLQEFLNAANSNTIRATNQYEVYCTSGYADIDHILGDMGVLFAQSITLPARGIEYAAVSFKGYEMGNIVPTKMTMEQEHAITFLDDVNGTLRRTFLAWQSKVMNANISDGSYFEGDRGISETSAIRVHMFDKDNVTVSQVYKFYNIRVTNVGNISLTYDGGDKSTFEVGFKSTYWEIETAKQGEFLTQR